MDVGQADAVLVRCDGEAMLLDGGNVADSSLIVAVLKELNVERLTYVVNSHPHEDHVGGLAGALNVCAAGHVYSSTDNYDSEAFRDFKRYAETQGRQIELPKAGDTWSLGEATVKVLGPVRDYEETNNTSLVLRLDYGQTSFLFTGDMEREAEQDLLTVVGEAELNCDVLKVGHHGSETSTSYPFLRAVMPEYGIISVGADNSYGHPEEAILSRLGDAGVQVYRTDLQGDVIATSDGRTVTVTTEKVAKPQVPPVTSQPFTTPETALAGAYIGNKKSEVFHLPSCKNLPAEKNRIWFDSREEAVSAGFRPCGNCNP